MKLTVNGRSKEIDNIKNIEELVGLITGKTRGFIVQLNKKIIKRDQWNAQNIDEGDAIELCSIVGGGGK